MTADPLIGRVAELAEVDRFLDGLSDGAGCLLLEGEVGIGKTALLNEARASAVARGYQVLAASPVEAEVPWEFAALADLLGTVARSAFDELPDPQRHAIAVAVFRDEPSESPVDPRTLATAVLRVLRRLAEESPVVLVIDDLPWLDAPSARVLSFVLRRAGDAAIGMVGTVRIEWSGDPAPLVTDQVEAGRVARVTVGPISVGAMRELLTSRTGLNLGRTRLLRLHELSRGNPLFAIELVKPDVAVPVGEETSSLDVPESLSRLMRGRITPLDADARDVLLLAALSGDSSWRVVLAAAGQGDGRIRLEELTEAGIVQDAGDAVTFVHPLFRSVVVRDATAAQRRAAHRRLATAVGHDEARARHLALGAEGPDEAIAHEMEEVALGAAARGARDTGATLAELAVQLTPPDRVAERHRRMALEAENRFESSNPVRACALLEAVVDEMAPGPARAELLARLARYLAFRGDPMTVWIDRLTAAMEESGDDLELKQVIALDRAVASNNAGDLAGAEEYGVLALELAEQTGDVAVQAQLCGGMAFVAFMRGEGVRRDLVERALTCPEQSALVSMELRPRVAVGHLLHLSGDLEGARDLYEQEYRRALEDGIETGLPLMLWGLVETEAWAGHWGRAEQLVGEGCELAEDAGNSVALAFMTGARALVHVYRGRLTEGRADAEQVRLFAEATGMTQFALQAAQCQGLAELSVGDAAAAHARLAALADVVRATGVTEPGMLRFLPDEMEALVRLGELDAADELLAPFEARSVELGRTWGLATSGRCRALLLAAGGDLDGAEAALGAALDHHQRLAMPFEHGRTLMVAGEIHRRARHKRRAREALEGAATVFASLGSPIWEERARDELGHLGLRGAPSSAPGAELTEMERRVADLVAGGLSNREVAAQLFMAQRTVEAHLSRIYRKLGVRSRVQLSRVYSPAPGR